MIRIGGIKFSEELVQITFTRKSPTDSPVEPLLQFISLNKLNIPFVCHSATQPYPETILCIDRSDFQPVEHFLKGAAFTHTNWSYIESVGSLTIFPHRNSFLFLGNVLNVLGENGFPVYAISSSISALALTTDYNRLEDVATCLQEQFELPENHAPFRQEFQLKQFPD